MSGGISVSSGDQAWIEFQLLLLDHGAQIRDEIPDADVWADIETRLTQ
jgi:hypothetical protein